jgi:DNA-binding MarR family transcriptional regulator
MWSLIHAARAIEQRIESALEVVQLSLPKFTVLTTLVDAGIPLTLSELAARSSCVRSNMTQLIDRLEADGLVRRVDDPHDRRSVRAELTPLGRERQTAGARQMDTVRDQFAALLPDNADLVALCRTCTALN